MWPSYYDITQTLIRTCIHYGRRNLFQTVNVLPSNTICFFFCILSVDFSKLFRIQFCHLIFCQPTSLLLQSLNLITCFIRQYPQIVVSLSAVSTYVNSVESCHSFVTTSPAWYAFLHSNLIPEERPFERNLSCFYTMDAVFS